jgi:hypothetical protein
MRQKAGMTYNGTVRNGVIVLDRAAALEDGTRVRVEPEPEKSESLRRGSPEAVLAADLKWVGDPQELDDLLAEVQRMRDDDIELQRRRDL